MLTANNITQQFGAKPLFENISQKFGGGNRYGLIGANGCGKSTFMKILGSDLEQTSGNVSLDTGERLGKLAVVARNLQKLGSDLHKQQQKKEKCRRDRDKIAA